MKKLAVFALTATVLAPPAHSRMQEAPTSTPTDQTIPARSCAPYAGMHFICEQKNAEDLEYLPGTKWVIATGMNNKYLPGNGFGIIDAVTARWHPGYPRDGAARTSFDRASYGACAGPPDPKRFGPHGLSIRRETDGSFTLYATNHGERETVEVLRIVIGKALPEMTWIGCVSLPGPAIWNAVAARPKGGFYVTRMFGNSADRWTRYIMGAKDGAVFEWQAQSGLKDIPTTHFAGNNGIAVSGDGHWLFVNSRLSAEVVKLDLTVSPPREVGRIKLNFLPDNVKWTGDGTITVTGHHAGEDRMSEINATPAPSGPIAWSVARVDPATMTIMKRMDVWGNRYFGGGTTGLQVGDEIWAGSFRADRIARVPVNWRPPE